MYLVPGPVSEIGVTCFPKMYDTKESRVLNVRRKITMQHALIIPNMVFNLIFSFSA